MTSVDHRQVVDIVARQAGVTHPDGERAVRATLQTLAERISRGQARHLAEQLPDELVPWILTDHGGQGFGVDEFVRRVAAREDVDPATAEDHVRRMPVEEFVARVAEREGVTPDEAVAHTRVVLAVLREAVGDEFFDVVVELPNDDDPLRPIPS